MLVNFALSTLGTQISCDKVSSDGYEPDNLLQAGGGWRRQGFLAERFIKPPVTLTLTFPCPVHISHIVLDPQVGSQRSSAIEIYTATRGITQRQFGSTTNHSALSERTVTFDGNRAAEGSCHVSQPEPIFKKAAFIRCSEPGRICFSNPRFRGNTSSRNTESVDICPHRCELRHHQGVMLAAADFLSVRIVGTINGKVAAVGQVEVWGLPARSCPANVKGDMVQRYMTAGGLSVQQSSDTSSLKANSGGTEHSRSSSHTKQGDGAAGTASVQDRSFSGASEHCLDKAESSGVDIPEEFLDELTWEMMSTPMLLPSGHSVDIFTLDKFSDAEATYGRQPSDPYTGLTFTTTRKPVLNKALKMRIDRFLSEHADEPLLRSVPRVLGKAPQVFSNTVSIDQSGGNLVSNIVDKNGLRGVKRKSAHESHVNSLQTIVGVRQQSLGSSENTLRVSNVSRTNVKKIKTEREGNMHNSSTGSSAQLHSKSEPKPDSGTMGSKSSCPQLGNCSSAPPNNTCTPVPQANSSSESHEEQLRTSLSSSLSSVLRSLPAFSFTPTSSQQITGPEVPMPDQQCSVCRTPLAQDANGLGRSERLAVYKFPCEHLVCRSCLTKSGNTGGVLCHMCKKQFTRADIVRTHV